MSSIPLLAVSNGKVFAIDDGVLATCPVNGCPTGRTPIMSGLGDVRILLADDTYLYMAKPGEPGTKTGSILACELPNCTNLRTLASGLAYPNSLHVDEGVLYWSNAGDVPGTGSIQRLRL